MRSVVITIGTRLHHLRYPIGIVEDIGQLLPGGFYEIFKRDADIPTCHLLLWAGLQHEGVTYEQAGQYLISEGAAYNPDLLLGFWKKITEALILDKWIQVSRDSDAADDRPLAEVIRDMEKTALSEFNISPDIFYGLTPREFEIYSENFGLRHNLHTGMICATICNALAPRKDGGYWKPDDFMRTGRKPHIQTEEEQKAAMAQMFGGG